MIAEPQTRQQEPITSEEERLYTAEDLLEISARGENRYELIRGKLITMAPAGSEHGHLALGLGARIRIFVENHELGVAFAAETGFILERNPDLVRAPDVGFVRKERLPEGSLPSTYFPGAPDLAVEVVSPHDAAADVQNKVQDWLTHGTQLVWVVEPKSQTVTVFRADGSARVLKPGDTLEGENVLPGFTFEVAKLFAR